MTMCLKCLGLIVYAYKCRGENGVMTMQQVERANVLRIKSQQRDIDLNLVQKVLNINALA